MRAEDFLDGASNTAPMSAEDFLGPNDSGSKPPKQNAGIVGDIGTALKRGVLQMPGMATGLADIAAAPVSIATGVNRPVSRAADWLGEQTGFQPGKWAEAAGAEYSPEMQQAQQNVEQAKGFFPTLGAVAQNPRMILPVVGESLPATIAGGLVARGAMGAVAGAEKLAALRTAAGSADAAVANAARRELLKSGAIAAGVGEGAVTAGQQMAQTGYDVDPALAAGAAIGAGVGTGIIGGLSGRIAGSALGRKLGLSDIETSMAAGTFGENAGKAGAAGYARRIGAGAIQEGLLEEAPQSYQEQVWQNLAAGKPLTEGAAEAAALGAVAGGVMGGGVNAISGPLSKAVAAAPGAGVQPSVPVPDGQQMPVPTSGIDAQIAVERPANFDQQNALEALRSKEFSPVTTSPIQGENAPLEPVPAAGIASAAQPQQAPTVMPVPQATQNAPAAPGSPSPVSAADPLLPAKQAEAAGAPISPPQGPLPSANKAEIAIPPAQGPEAAALPTAAKPAKGIAASLQYPQQITEGGGPLAQQAADMPIGEFGKRAPVASRQTPTDSPQRPLSGAGTPQARRQPQPAPIMRRDDLVGAIMRVTGGDGIASSMALTTAKENAGKNLPRLRGLFTNRGWEDLGEIATLLRNEEGFSVRDGEHLSQLIEQAASGTAQTGMARTERDLDAERDARHRDYIRQNAKKLKIKSVAVKFSDLEKQVIAALTRRHERAVELLDERAKKRFDAALEESYALLPEDVVDAVLVDVSGRGLSSREFWNQATETLRYMVSDAKAQKEQGALNAIEGAEPDWLKDDDGRGNQPAGGREEANRVVEEAGGEAYSVGDEITFAPHPERRLDSEVSGILVAKESTGSGRFRLRIRTDRPSPQGDGFVTLQVYSQNGSVQKIGDGLNAEAADAVQKAATLERGSVGASLTKEQRKSVFRTLVDVYKANKAPRESKGFDRSGEEIFGYAYSPEYFVKSDITGKMVRYYVTLPDGKVAHPTELFPDYTQSNIEGELLRQKEEERQAKYAIEFHKRLVESRKADDIQSANRIFWKQNSGGNIKPPETILYTNGKQFVRGLKTNKDKDLPVLGEGWTVVPVPTFEESKAFDLAAQTPEEIAAAEAAAKEAKQAEAAAAAAEARKEKAAQDKAEKDRRAAEVLKEREAAKKAEVDKAAEEFALGQAAPEPVVKKVTTEEARGQEDLRFSQESSQDNQPAFYSQLSSAIASARVTSQPAAQWKAWINGNAGNLGIKKDEIEWSGILDYLDVRGKDKVTKTEIADYLSGNGVRVEDVVKGAPDSRVDAGRKLAESQGHVWDDLSSRDQGRYIRSAAGEPITNRGETDTKFSGYWQDSYKGGIPGTYREILVTLPASRKGMKVAQHPNRPEGYAIQNQDGSYLSSKSGTVVYFHIREAAEDMIGSQPDKAFRSNHWDEPNVLVHIRTDEVIGADGKRYLRVGEIQSDWGQKGKKEGFKGRSAAEIEADLIKIPDGDPAARPLLDELKAARDGVPQAPFVTDTRAWAALGIKRAIIHAINSGVDGVVFGTGEQNANLYDLSKQVSEINYRKEGDGSFLLGLKDRQGDVLPNQSVPAEKLEETVGKEVAQRMLDGEGADIGSGLRKLSGLDLKVGGEGMRAFYDQIIPSVANDVLKKVGGGKVESVSINKWVGTNPLTGRPKGEKFSDKNRVEPQPGFTITPQMRAKIQSQGVPLFSFAGQQSATADQFQLDRAKQLLADGANANSVRQQTGWFKGVDGKWRYEIDDSGASLKAHGFGFGELLDALGKNLTLAEVLDHPALFAAYPSIARSSVEAIDEKSQNNGELITNKDGGFTIRVNAGLGEAKALSVMLHEIQHGIQNVEGFATGGNVKDVAKLPQFKDAQRQAEQLERETGAYIAPNYGLYRRLAGEVESRNVQQRQNFPADKRRLSDPLGTQDVAPEDVIVVFNGKDAKDAPAPANTTRASAMAAVGASPADAAVFDMASEGRSAQEILAFLSKASRRPFNRVLAAALSRIGVSSTVSIDPAAGWRNSQNRQGAKFAASYSPKTDTISLFTPREAERHILHEFVHAASLKAIARGGPAARQMQAIFDYVQKTGTMSDQYGMGNFSRFPNETDAQFKKRALDEFTAELFTNPQFQVRLKQLPAPSGSKLKSAWDWIVRVIANLLGLKTKAQETALDRALSVGAALLQENAALTSAQNGERFSQEQPFSGREVAATPLKPGTTTLMVDGVERPALNSNGKPIHWSDEGVRNFWRWFQNSAVTDGQGRPRVVYHGAKEEFSKFNLEMAEQDVDGIWLTDTGGYASWAASGGPGGRRRGVVMDLYLRAENPMIFDILEEGRSIADQIGEAEPKTSSEAQAIIAGGMGWDTAVSDLAREAKSDGRDALIIKSFNDGYLNDANTTTAYVAFDPNQIKSATANTGAFSPEDPDIRYSLATNWQQSPVAPGNLYQAAKKKAASLLTPERLDKVIYETQDKFIDLRRIRDHIKEIGGTITDLNDAYLGEELYHKRLAYRTEQFLKEELQPFFADMKARGVEMPEFEKFLHARHAPEANAEMARRNPNQKQIDAGRQKSAATVRALELNLQTAKARGLATVAIEKALNDARAELVRWNSAQAFKGTEAERLSLSGMSNAAAGALMASLTPAQLANMNALAAKVDAINDGTLQTLERYGLMDKASMNTWRNTYKHYVPLHRDEAHPDSASHPIGQGFNVRGDASKRRTGSNQEVTNIFGHIAMQREAALTRGEKNRVMQKLYLMARQNLIADIWSVGKVPMIDTIDKATGFVRSVPDPQYKDKPNVITLRIGGKDVAIVMNEYNPQALRLAQSIKNLDVDDLHYLIPVVGKATRWFASINTQYNPIFGLINFARDVQTAALNLSTTAIAGKQKEVFKDTMSILGDIIKNKGRMPTAGKWAPIYKEFNEVGGTTGYRDLFLTAEDRSKAVTDEIKALDRGKVSQAAHAVAGWLSDYNEAMENATRLAAYKAAIDNGMSKERAASLAKNLTVNFNRKGRQTRELGALYAFFNAAVQGTARMAQTLSGPAGKKIMLGGVLAGAASAMAGIAAMGGGDGEDDEWSKIPEFVKERSFIIPAGKDKYIAIPMPLGFHFLPNIGRLAVEMAVYKDKTLGKQMASLFTVLADAFNPLGGSAPPMQIIAPTVMDPFIALAQNKDWTGKPIYVENFNSLNPQPGAARAKDSATPIAKGLADIINSVTGGTKYVPGAWSPTPDQIDYVIGQLTGGVGRELGKMSSTIAAPFTGDELPAHKIPLLGRLYGSTAGATGQAGKFYENIKRANEVENELKGRRKDGISADDYLQDNPKAVELAARGNAAERQIRALRQMRSRIVEAGGDDAASKARQINERMATVMRGFNMQVERMQ